MKDARPTRPSGVSRGLGVVRRRLRGPRWTRVAQEVAPQSPEGPVIDAAAPVTDRDRMPPDPVTVSSVLADLLPRPMLVLAAWSLVVIAVAGAGSILVDTLDAVSMVVVPVALALLVTALLEPVAASLAAAGLPRAVASLLTVVVPTSTVLLGIVLAASEIANGAAQLSVNAQAGVDSVLTWLRTGPLQLSQPQLTAYLDEAADAFRADTALWSSGAVSAGVAVIDIVAGLVICLITTFFFLLDGGRMWRYCVRIVPRGVRGRVHEAGRRGWVSLGAYSRAQIVVATVNALGIAAGAWLLGLPLVLPILILVFVFSFVPIIGAFVAGLVPTLIAFVAHGPLTALAMLGIVLVVQQCEAHLLQPFLMGKAVDLHPLAVILAVSAATYLYGIPGALFAVPALAFVNSTVHYLAGDDPFPELGRTTPGRPR